MPELPEVESFKNYLEETSLNQKIKKADITDSFMLWDTTEDEFESALKGNTFLSSHRHGKYLFIKLKEKGNLMVHFGMTGYFEYFNDKDNVEGNYAMRIDFENNHTLLFRDPRKIGKLAIVADVQEFIKKRGYGPDALKISEQDFLKTFHGRKSNIKSALMDQKLVAGVGNEFSDEILFQVKLHPETKVNKLNKDYLKNIYKTMQKILKEAISVNADRDKLSHYFFLDHRKAGLKCPGGCAGKTEFKTVGGRSAYFCPSCQKKIDGEGDRIKELLNF